MSAEFQLIAAVASNRKVKRDVHLLSFRSPAVARAARPGQFLHLRIPECSAPLLRRPFSIHDVIGDRIFVLYRIAGAGTLSLSRIEPGREIDIIGPLGSFFVIDANTRPHLVVAGGIGIAPLQFLLRRIKARGIAPVLFYGCPTKNDLVPHLRVDRLLATDDGTCGRKGFVTAAFEQAVDRYSGARVYACGPWPMLRAVARACRARALSCQTSLEARLACGVGACQGCVVKGLDSYLTVCRDGPVFDAKNIDWDQAPVV
ncbi:MAG: dihydroorotate dehydrogenase electron transfer subunit [Candidatus Edwardsbacteria bacterium]|nr:dihydroorotate dehydrogenase electron transfer subunit [Candidatus Edwardsbacteria bacterium]